MKSQGHAGAVMEESSDWRRTERQLAAQQSAMGELSIYALEESRLVAVLDRAVHLVCKTLETDCCAVLERTPDGKLLLLQAGTGWQEGVAQGAEISAGPENLEGYTLAAGVPVIVTDFAVETRFPSTPLLDQHGIVSAVTVMIRFGGVPYGMFGAYSKTPRQFTQLEVIFLQVFANLLSVAVERQKQLGALKQQQDCLRLALSAACMGTWRLDLDSRREVRDASFNEILGLAPTDSTQSMDDLPGRIHPEDRKGFEAELNRSMSERHSFTAEYRIVRPDGRERWLQHRGDFVDSKQRILIGAVMDVSQRKQDEEILARHAAIVESSRDAITSTTLDGTIVSWNRTAAQIFGYSAEEVLDRSIEILVPPGLREEMAGFYQRLRSGEHVLPFETVHLRKDGRRIDVAITASPIRDRRGQIIGISGIARDITEKKAVERELREREERFRTIADAAPVMIWMCDENRACSYLNKGWLEFAGRPFEADISRSWVERIHLDDLPHFLSIFYGAFDQRAPFHIEYRLRRADGEYRWVLDYGVPRFEQERFAGFIGIAIDITERKRAEAVLREEAALRESEARFREVADAMPQIVWTTDAQGQFDYFNSRFYEWTGLEAQKPGKESWQVILHPEQRESCLRAFQECIRNGQPFQVEGRLLDRRTGRYRWHLTRALPVRDGTGTIVRWIGTATDIEDQKKTEQALQEAQAQLQRHAGILERQVAERTAELEASLQSMEGFCHTIAHDLRAPARALQGLTTALMEDYMPLFDEAGRDYAVRIIVAAARMDRLIKDLLDYGRLSHVDLPLAPVDLQACVGRVLNAFAEEISHTRATVVVETPLPSVWANEIIVEQALSNLVGNALKFVPKGTPPRVRIRAAKTGDAVRVEVQDAGIGIAPEHQHRIFQVFERLHGPEHYPGTGIGLAIVKKGIERTGGRIGVSSHPGQGSCFWFELPVGPPRNS